MYNPVYVQNLCSYLVQFLPDCGHKNQGMEMGRTPCTIFPSGLLSTTFAFYPSGITLLEIFVFEQNYLTSGQDSASTELTLEFSITLFRLFRFLRKQIQN